MSVPSKFKPTNPEFAGQLPPLYWPPRLWTELSVSLKEGVMITARSGQNYLLCQSLAFLVCTGTSVKRKAQRVSLCQCPFTPCLFPITSARCCLLPLYSCVQSVYLVTIAAKFIHHSICKRKEKSLYLSIYLENYRIILSFFLLFK